MHDRIVDLILSLKSRCLDKEESIRLEFGLSPAEYRGILAMKPNEPCNCNALSSNMGLSVSRGSRIVEKLIKNKYLEQEVSKKRQKKCNSETCSKRIEGSSKKLKPFLTNANKLSKVNYLIQK